jgi:hypothetical protein
LDNASLYRIGFGSRQDWEPVPGIGDASRNAKDGNSRGEMVEGVTSEAALLAGDPRLSDLCWIYDNNHVTIESRTDIAFTEDVAVDGQNRPAIKTTRPMPVH